MSFSFSFFQSVSVCCHNHYIPCQLCGVWCPLCQSSSEPHRARPEPLWKKQSDTSGCHYTKPAVHTEVQINKHQRNHSNGIDISFCFSCRDKMTLICHIHIKSYLLWLFSHFAQTDEMLCSQAECRIRDWPLERFHLSDFSQLPSLI